MEMGLKRSGFMIELKTGWHKNRLENRDGFRMYMDNGL